MGKKIALVQCAASAASTAGVFFGQGPSSKVSTTSPGRRKSWVLKCSNPNCGPPVVSISTTRETPNALGLPGQEDAAPVATGSAAPTVGSAYDASITVVPARTGSAGAGGAATAILSDVFCERMAPETATPTIISRVNAAAMRRITNSPQAPRSVGITHTL